MYYKKIVFTGGPCSGKSTLIKKLKKYLESKDCEVLIIPETATKTFDTGFRYDMVYNVDNFQKVLFDIQKSQEDMVNYILNLNKDTNRKFIIIYDRGILDNKAYFDNYKAFDKLLGTTNSEISVLDSYDMVFNLITLADCKPEEYNLSSNEARSEDKELALKIDRKTSNAWAGHRNINIINTSISVEEELDIIKRKIDELLNYINTKEIKTIELDNEIEDFTNYDDNNSRLIDVEENIIDIPTNKDVYYKLYKRTYKGKESYLMNVNYKKDNKIITVYDSKISEDDYKQIIFDYKIRDSIKYKQLSFVKNRQVYDIKFYNDKTLLEYEENLLNEKFILPEPLKIKENSFERKKLLKPIINLPVVKHSVIV